jgi:hypothetical protein
MSADRAGVVKNVIDVGYWQAGKRIGSSKKDGRLKDLKAN